LVKKAVDSRTCRITPLAAVASGLLAGIVGTASIDFSYLVLPEGGLYKPIWQYDARTLAGDLVAHLAYGAGTGTAFWALASLIRAAGSP
jgi:hypothetical protein